MSVAQASLPVIMGTQKTARSRDTSYKTEAFAYGGDDELFWEESKSDNMFMSPSMLKSGGIAGMTESGKATLVKDPKSGKVALVIPKVSDTSYNMDNTFHGYESGVLLYKKNINGAVLEGEASALWNKTEFYTYLNGLKVGIYTESEASDFTLNKGKENKGSEGRESEDKTGRFVGGGPETHNYYCSYDGQGNVSQVSNMAGDEPYSLYAYDSYGTQTGSDYSNDSFSSYKGYDKGPFGYKTGVRQYDPETGRFLSPDTFKGYITDPASQHPYMYCHGNPVKFVDPSGYEPVTIIVDGSLWIGFTVITPGAKLYRQGEGANKSINEIYSSQDFASLNEMQQKRVRRMLDHYRIIYHSCVDLKCGDAAGKIRDQMQTALGKDSVPFTRNGRTIKKYIYDVSTYMQEGVPPDNFGKITIEGVPGAFYFYGGSIGPKPVQWVVPKKRRSQ